MKRNFLILNFILIFSVNCIAQPVWVGTSNPNVLAPYSPTTTKVGIGTSTPYNQNWSQLTIQNLSSGAGLNLINSNQNWEIQNVGSGAFIGSLVFFNRTNLNYGLSITSSGNVGIGINDAIATAKLEVKGNVKIRNGQLDVVGRIISSGGHIDAYNGHIQLGGDYQRWGFYTETWSTTSKKLFISPAIITTGGWDYGKELILDGDGSMVKSVMTGGVKAFSVYQVGLGSDVFRVMGDGKVYATEVNVSLATNFPDYVFSEDYKLMNLGELESFISKNKHLPDVPSAQEIDDKDNNINVGEMQIILLKKIEELTLYLIELKKENEKLKEKVESDVNN